MSNRIRVVAKLPNQGVWFGPQAYLQVENRWNTYLLQLIGKPPVLPTDFETWPRWKRCKWIAKQMKFAFIVFREPRNVSMKKSKYGRYLLNEFGEYPQRQPKKKKLNLDYVARVQAEMNSRVDRIHDSVNSRIPRIREDFNISYRPSPPSPIVERAVVPDFPAYWEDERR